MQALLEHLATLSPPSWYPHTRAGSSPVSAYLNDNTSIKIDPTTGHTDLIKDTPLFVAVHCRNLPVVELLLRHNADVTLRDIGGNTLLHECAELNHFDEDDGGATVIAVARLLLNHQPTNFKNMKDLQGHTALENAKESGFNAMVRLLSSGSRG
jgi:ankyrin repeat protein